MKFKEKHVRYLIMFKTSIQNTSMNVIYLHIIDYSIHFRNSTTLKKQKKHITIATTIQNFRGD